MNIAEEPAMAHRVQLSGTLSERLRQLDRYWRAANYLTVGQIYL